MRRSQDARIEVTYLAPERSLTGKIAGLTTDRIIDIGARFAEAMNVNNINLHGRNAVVTGGARGIGYACAQRILDSGGRVCLWDLEEAHRQEELSKSRRSQVQTGDRSEKIRTYNFPQDRVTDHRIGLTRHNLPGVLNGELDEFIDTLITADQADKMQHLFEEEVAAK